MNSEKQNVMKGAIFDCDGTLLDSLGAWRGLEGELARSANVQVRPEERKLFCTLTIPEIAHYFHVEYGLGENDAAVSGMIDEYMMSYYCNASLLPGAAELLEACSKSGVRMSVCSSSCASYLEAGLSSSGVRDYFQAVVSVDDLGTTKRSPEAFEHTCKLLGTEKQVTWGFEDSLYAMDTLRNAGFPVVGLYCEKDGVPQLQVEKRATIAVPSLERLTVEQGVLAQK